ncbi:hypothetical protein L2E82_39849 [Cichorium intybus]|uniref:Uncharacterized protein n=1 Tax=Cichorium intybus TaxID=13427 RepID=A0ACB9AJD8_CICIN|nr:hypothetical protein L2E82_39849 [Cichorium intybus]
MIKQTLTSGTYNTIINNGTSVSGIIGIRGIQTHQTLSPIRKPVAIKTLIVIHRTLREGDPTFREELVNFLQRGRVLQLGNFKDDSNPTGWDCSAWVRTYGLLLEERLECFRVLKYDIKPEKYQYLFKTSLDTFITNFAARWGHGSKKRKIAITAILYGTLWCIWIARNNRVKVW